MSNTDFSGFNTFSVKSVTYPVVKRPLVKKLPFEHIIVDSANNVFKYVIDTTFNRTQYYYLYTLYAENE